VPHDALTLSPNLASSDFYLLPPVKEKLERIQVADEDQFFEPLHEIVRSIDQEEFKGIFQAWMGRVQEVRQRKTIETTPDDKQFSSILVRFNFIRQRWRMFLSTRR
jgi:hypothetical protein